MRFLVTGATGFIGTHLVKRLVSEAHAVTALVRTPPFEEAIRRTAEGYRDQGWL